MNDFSEKLFAAMLRYGVSQSAAVKISELLSEVWETDRQPNADDLRDIERIAASVSAVGRRRQGHAASEEFPDKIQPAEPKKNKPEIPGSRFFNKFAGLRNEVRVPLSYILPVLLCIAAVIVIAAAAALIAAMILLAAAATVSGILVFITGLLYGISQLHVFHGAGLYEIGLGLIIGSLFAAATVLLYNGIIKGIPFCTKLALRHIFSAVSKFRIFRLATAKKRR